MGTKTFHFELPCISSDVNLTLHINQQTYELKTHSQQTLKNALKHNKAMCLIPKKFHSCMTHYVEVDEDLLPKENLSRIQVTSPSTGGGLPVLHHMSYYIPEKHRRKYFRDKIASGKLYFPPKFYSYNTCADIKTIDPYLLEEIHLDAELYQQPWDIAKSILFNHPELGTNKPYTASIVMNDHIAPDPSVDPEQFNKVYNLATAISSQGPGNWAKVTDSVDKDGNTLYYEYDLGSKKAGDKVQIYDLSDETLKACNDPLNGAMRSANDDGRLQNQNWSLNQGATAIVHDVGSLPELLKEASGTKNYNYKAEAFKWTVNELTPSHGLNAYNDTISFTPDGRFSIEVKNIFLRTLCAYAEFFDDNGMVIQNPAGWEEQLPEFLRFFETDSKKYISIVSAVNTIMGIPMPTDPTGLGFVFPKEASSVKLLFGGLGITKWDNDVDVSGALLTGVFQYGIPIFFMAASAAVTSTKFFNDFIKDKDNLAAVLGVAFGVVGGGVATASALMNTKRVLFTCANAIAGILVKKGLEALMGYIVSSITVQAVETEIPYVGWALKLANIAIDLAGMAVTTGEILSSPATLTVEVKRAMDLRLILKPDPAHGEAGHPETAVWPAVGDNYQITVQYKGGTNRVLKGKLPATTSSTPIDVTYYDIPVGGMLQIIAGIYSENGWLCGKWQSDWLDAFPDSGTTKNVSGNITEILVPLTQDTQYDYKEKIVYDKESQKHIWHAGDRPTATIKDLDNSGIGNHLCKLVNLTINNTAFQVGYAWRASGEGLPPVSGGTPAGLIYLCQNLSVLANPESRIKTSEVGFNQQINIAYDQFSTQQGGDKSISQDNFILDTRNGEFNLRNVNLDDGKSGFGLNDPDLKSWGKFNLPHLDAMVVHPDRSVIAVSWQDSKMEILKIPDQPSPDKDAPIAQMVSGRGVRQGLLSGPAALNVTPDGRVLVLETLSKRIQAFDTSGNPVPCFTGLFLFSLPASEYAPDLDKGIFSEALQEQFLSHDLTHLFDMDKGYIADLDSGKLTDRLIQVFDANGVYLSYDKDKMEDPTVSSYVTVVTKNTAWTITDPGKNCIYNIRVNGDAVSVYDVLNNVTVTVRKLGSEWVIQDLNGAESYLAAADAKDPSKLNLNRYLSYTPLYNPESRPDTVYLDMAVESKGYIYVLSYTGDGEKESDYKMDIYQPDGTFLVRTPDPRLQPVNPQYLNTARLAVDVWRNVYTLNYEAISGPSNRTEPSISHWIPTPPLFDLDLNTEIYFETGDMTAIRNLFAAHGKILSDSATVATINPRGYWQVTDGLMIYDVIRTVQNLEVYDIPGGV